MRGLAAGRRSVSLWGTASSPLGEGADSLWGFLWGFRCGVSGASVRRGDSASAKVSGGKVWYSRTEPSSRRGISRMAQAIFDFLGCGFRREVPLLLCVLGVRGEYVLPDVCGGVALAAVRQADVLERVRPVLCVPEVRLDP